MLFSTLTGDIMLDALIGAVFAIISYSKPGRSADYRHADRHRRYLVQSGAVSGDWR
ncbi:hypothetical protein E05_00350 [Plautia stali symbiont]|nr:hypothetical protein E05_00350 [Plautia stali symbiont]